jgi:hypothetical protein
LNFIHNGLTTLGGQCSTPSRWQRWKRCSRKSRKRDEYRKLVLHLREKNERHKRRQPAAPRPSGHGRVMQMARALAA